MRGKAPKVQHTITVREALCVEYPHLVHFDGISRSEVISRVMNNGEPITDAHKVRHVQSVRLKFIIASRNPEFYQSLPEIPKKMHGHKVHKKDVQAIVEQWLVENEGKYEGGIDATPGEFESLWRSHALKPKHHGHGRGNH